MLLVAVLTFAISLSVNGETLRLWEGDAPGALGNADKDIPTITVYRPTSNANGAAIVICPGGSYHGLASHEGEGYARYLNKFGITAFVLKYRLYPAGYHHPCMLQDAARAVRVVRYNAEKWGVDANRVAIMGSSAGGHLASTLVTHFEAANSESKDPIDALSSRPDLGILCYPVVTMGEYTHQGSKMALIGNEPSPELVELLSNEKQVTKDTPPCFIWHTWNDSVVPVENSINLAVALRKNGVPFDLHIFEQGPHGLGLAEKKAENSASIKFYGEGVELTTNETETHPWGKDLIFWLKVRKFID